MSIQPYPLWDIQIIITLQHYLGALVPFLKGVSIILGPGIYFFIATFLYFTDRKKGLYSLVYLALATLLSLSLKDIIHHPRPFWTSPFVTGFISPRDYGMPSGHALFSFYLIFLASLYRKAWGFILAFTGVALVCLSRMVLGAHYFEQVLAGLGLGFFCMLFTPSVVYFLNSKKLSPRGIFVSLILSNLLVLILLAFLFIQQGLYFVPLTEWNVLASRWNSKPLASPSFLSLVVPFLFSLGILFALFFEEQTLKIKGIAFFNITLKNILFLCLITLVYTLSSLIVFILLYALTPPLAFCALAFWAPFFCFFLFPLELSYLELIYLTDSTSSSKIRYLSLAFYLKRPYER